MCSVPRKALSEQVNDELVRLGQEDAGCRLPHFSRVLCARSGDFHPESIATLPKLQKLRLNQRTFPILVLQWLSANFRPNLEKHMRKLRDSFWALFVLLLSSAPFALCQNSSLHGIDVTDLDRKAAPCDDFLRIRQRHLARQQSDSRFDDPLEQALAGGRILERQAARNSRSRRRRQERAPRAAPNKSSATTTAPAWMSPA